MPHHFQLQGANRDDFYPDQLIAGDDINAGQKSTYAEPQYSTSEGGSDVTTEHMLIGEDDFHKELGVMEKIMTTDSNSISLEFTRLMFGGGSVRIPDDMLTVGITFQVCFDEFNREERYHDSGLRFPEEESREGVSREVLEAEQSGMPELVSEAEDDDDDTEQGDVGDHVEAETEVDPTESDATWSVMSGPQAFDDDDDVTTFTEQPDPMVGAHVQSSDALFDELEKPL